MLKVTDSTFTEGTVNEVRALQELSCLEEGGFVCWGTNLTGKSTLLNAVAGISPCG